MKILLFMCWILLATRALSQPYPGPIAIGRAGVGTTLRGIWALQQNPAGIANIDAGSIELGYVRHFMDRELSTQTVLLGIPIMSHKFGIGFQKYGVESYSEQLLGVTYARSFGRKLSLGIGFTYHGLQIQHYGGSSKITAKAGFQFEFSDRFSLGAYIFNPSLNVFSSNIPTRIPAMMAFGFDLKLTNQIKLAAELHKQFSDPLDARIGLEYSPLSWFSVRGGISAIPFTNYAGFSINQENIKLSAAVSSHLSLGISPQISLGYEF